MSSNSTQLPLADTGDLTVEDTGDLKLADLDVFSTLTRTDLDVFSTLTLAYGALCGNLAVQL